MARILPNSAKISKEPSRIAANLNEIFHYSLLVITFLVAALSQSFQSNLEQLT